MRKTTLGKQVIESVIADMDRRRGNLPAPQLRYFLDTYQRTTRAIAAAIDDARFEDPDWVERWDVAFARLYLDALDAGDGAPRPWRLALSAPAELPPLRHVLLGINAHVNYDLPQALLAVISVGEFGDAALLDRRRHDHERIDGVLASRVGAEDDQLSTFGKSLLDRLLTPLNRIGSKRFLREGRQKVWRNTAELHAARVAGPDTYRARLAELEVLSAARIADLLAPGQVILRLAVGGFGVLLPPT
jgi:uncharacterized protein DUF5995